MFKKIMILTSILLFVGCAELPKNGIEDTIETNQVSQPEATAAKTTNPTNIEVIETENSVTIIETQPSNNDIEIVTNDDLKINIIKSFETPEVKQISVEKTLAIEKQRSTLTAMQIEALMLGLSLKQFEQLKKDFAYWEDLKNMVYLDPAGILVIGPAFALATKLESGKRRIFSMEKINKMFSEAGLPAITESNYQCMLDMNGSVNYEVRKGTLSKFLNRAEKNYSHGLYKLSDVKIQGGCTDNNYVLTDDEVHALLEYAVVDIYRNVKNSAKAQNINLSSLDFEIVEVVIELFYRGGHNLVLGEGKETPVVNDALRRNDKVAFGKEVYARSNGDKIWQNDLRNAAMIKRIKRTLSLIESIELDEFIASHPHARKVNKRLLKMFTKQRHFVDDANRKFVKQLVSMDEQIGFKIAHL